MTRRTSLRKKRDVFLRKAEKLKLEIEALQASLYNTAAKESRLRYENLKTYRAEVQRSFVLYMHLAIENLLRALLFDFLGKHNAAMSKRDLMKTVDDMRSAELVHWCGRLRLLKAKRYKQLLDLNRIRNTCAHNWLLDVPKYKKASRGRLRVGVKLPTVTYQGRNLLESGVLLNEFCPTYGRIYVDLLGTVWRLQGEI